MSDTIGFMREIANLQEQINALRTIEVGGVWRDWTPIVLSTVGTITSYTIQMARYTRIGKVGVFHAQFTITDNGTGSGAIQLTLPFTAIGIQTFVGRASTYMLVGFTQSTVAIAIRYDNAYPGVTGAIFRVTGTVEIA